MRAIRLAAALAALAAQPALAAPEEFLVEPGHTYPQFEVSHLGISTQRGRFGGTRGRIVLDRQAGTGTIDITIDASAVSTGNAALDAVVRGEDFLNVESFPAISYRSRRIDFEGEAPRRVSGDLTLAGRTRPVDLPRGAGLRSPLDPRFRPP